MASAIAAAEAAVARHTLSLLPQAFACGRTGRMPPTTDKSSSVGNS